MLPLFIGIFDCMSSFVISGLEKVDFEGLFFSAKLKGFCGNAFQCSGWISDILVRLKKQMNFSSRQRAYQVIPFLTKQIWNFGLALDNNN